MKLLFATEDKSKVCNMRHMLNGYDVEIVTPKELGIHIDVEETGTTPVENAKLKAKAYFEKTGIPTIAADSGLYIDDIPNDIQPGPYVRRVNNKTLSDDEMVSYYSSLSANYGGRLKARYISGLAILINDKEYTAQIADDDFFISSHPNSNRKHRGNPLDLVTICPANGKYFNDCSLDELSTFAGSFDKKCLKFFKDSKII